jgi:hypothetical protein
MAREAEAETLASISIARQISVSQRQRQLLVPIKNRAAGASGNSKPPVSLMNGVKSMHSEAEKALPTHAQNSSAVLLPTMTITTSSSEHAQTSFLPATPPSAGAMISPKRAGSVRAARENMRLAGKGNGMAGMGMNFREDKSLTGLEIPSIGPNGERVWVNEKKPLTPTLVEVGGHAQSHGHMYRKSERVVFERA